MPWVTILFISTCDNVVKVQSANMSNLTHHSKYEKTTDGFIVTYNNQAFDQVIADNIYYKFGMIVSLLLLIPSIIKLIYPSKN